MFTLLLKVQSYRKLKLKVNRMDRETNVDAGIR